MARKTGWTCQRVTKGVRCGQHNVPRQRKCVKCGKPRPVKRRPAHMVALESDYAAYVALNGGDYCWICGRLPSARRKLDRDHDHKTHLPRGLLCSRCNQMLPSWITVEWLLKAARYLRRSEHN